MTGASCVRAVRQRDHRASADTIVRRDRDRPIVPPDTATDPSSGHSPRRSDPAYEACWVLRAAFVIAPVLFGLDKFFNVLVEWEIYLAPQIYGNVPGSPEQIMNAVGAVEDVAGIAVAIAPGIGGWLVAAWLAGIIVNLLLIGSFYVVALRDVGLLLAAVALIRLAAAYDRTGRSR